MKRWRLTPAGVALSMGAVLLIAAGIPTSYREFIVLGAVALGAVVLARVLPRGASQLTLHRVLSRPMVQRGDQLSLRLRITPAHPLPPTRFIDRVGEHDVVIEAPSIAPAETRAINYRVTMTSRGVFRVGPLVEEGHDPFDLAARVVDHDLLDEVVVHPVIHDLGMGDGFAAIRQRQTTLNSISDDPLSEFRTLREYQPGDDTRLIHWPSSARTDTLVVRDFLDLRRMARVVLLETSDQVTTAVEFEESVEIAASLCVQSLEHGLVTVLRTDDPELPGPRRPIDSVDAVLDLTARSRRIPASHALATTATLSGGLPEGVVFLVTGERSRLLRHLSLHSSADVVVVRVSRRPHLLERLAVPTIDVQSAAEFARRWRIGAA